MKRKKRAVTLIEIMIVILLIGLIGGALAFNMRGSLDQGKAFKTKQTISRVYDSVMMEYARGKIDNLQEIVDDEKKLVTVLEDSALIKQKEASKMLKDAWGQKLRFSVENDELTIKSQKLDDWESVHAK